jgi:hypothetical protein
MSGLRCKNSSLYQLVRQSPYDGTTKELIKTPKIPKGIAGKTISAWMALENRMCL